MLSVIVPTFNRAFHLRGTLDSVASQKLKEGEFEVIVVDNGSTDDTSSVAANAARQWPSCKMRHVHEPVPGLLSGRHRGAKEAAGDVLVFIDDDIVAQEGWLESLRLAFTEPAVQLAGGRSVADYEMPPPPWLSELWHPPSCGGRINLWHSLIDLGDEPFDVEPCYVFGLNYAIRRRALHDLGGFHPDCIPSALQMFQGDGETGLSLKCKAEGYVARYVPGAIVRHQIPVTRLTASYMESRAFYAGVCDSYTYIRTYKSLNPKRHLPPPSGAKHISPAPRSRMQALWEGTVGVLVKRNPAMEEYKRDKSIAIEDMRKLTGNAFEAGYAFHQEAVAKSQILLDWVLRENYWDYRLPALNPTASREASP